MAGTLLAPGTLFYRQSDNELGMIIAVRQPHWDDALNRVAGWSFELFIKDMLVFADGFSSGYTLVQPDR